jgi:GNAT superfamily N-acetyltransferase
MEIIRAEQTWQQAAAYYVRIESMVKGFDIPVEFEIDSHDTPDTRYIVAFDGLIPVGTCRLYEKGDKIASIERVVVLEQYRKQGVGRQVIQSAEAWLKELGYEKIVITSRDVAVGFYEKLGYQADWSKKEDAGLFTLVYVEKEL